MIEVLAAALPGSQLLIYGFGTDWMLRWTIPFGFFALFNVPMLLRRAHEPWDPSIREHTAAIAAALVAMPAGVGTSIASAVSKRENLPFQSRLLYIVLMYGTVRPTWR